MRIMPIVAAMSTPVNTELDLELTRLEARVDELATQVAQLLEENRALRQRHDMQSSERASLLNKNEQVRGRVEAMIGRLKTLEHGA
jgi:cell division protein ZapB